MKRTLSLIFLYGLFLLASCFEPPEFSIIPSITFESVRTVNVANPQVADTLIVSIKFKDGDGDLGRDGTDNDPPFNQKWYFLILPIATCEETVKPPCMKTSFIPNNLGNVVKYSTRRENPDYDTLPLYTAPYDCFNYQILRDEDTNATIDTLYFQNNPRTHNFFCDIYVKEAGTFQKFELSTAYGCQPAGLPFNGAFGVLGIDGNPNLGLPLEGIIDFKARLSNMFETVSLKNKTVKLKIKIVDRAGNFSNEVESNEFIWK